MLGVSLRSYSAYENDASKVGTLKYQYMADLLDRYVALDEEHGILTVEEIRAACRTVFAGYPVKYAICSAPMQRGRLRGPAMWIS